MTDRTFTASNGYLVTERGDGHLFVDTAKRADGSSTRVSVPVEFGQALKEFFEVQQSGGGEPQKKESSPTIFFTGTAGRPGYLESVAGRDNRRPRILGTNL